MTPEIEEVVRYRFLGNTYSTRAEAEMARAYDILMSAIGTTPWNAMHRNPRHVIAVVTEYANELDRIKCTTLFPTICAANFVLPTDDVKWPDQAISMSAIYNFQAMCNEVDHLWQNNYKVAAIRIVRLCFGPMSPGLKKSKDWVEARNK